MNNLNNFYLVIKIIFLSFIITVSDSSAAKQLKPGEYTARINGVNLYYRIAGNCNNGRVPILFLHGGPGYNSYSFARLAGYRLEDTECMIYLDQRGCGRSERPKDNSYSISILVSDIEQLRGKLGVEKLVVMGHSFGGALALEYAAKYPERTAGVILPGGLSNTPGSVKIWFRQLRVWHPDLVAANDSLRNQPFYNRTMKIMQQLNVQDFMNRLQFHDQKFRLMQDSVDNLSGLQNTGEMSGELFNRGLSEYSFSKFDKLDAPVLVIGGRYDYSIGIETMRALSRKLKNAEIVEYRNSAHFPYLEEAEKFEQDVKLFMSKMNK